MNMNMNENMNPNQNMYAPKLSWWDWVALVILIIGGLAWGVVGLVGLNVIATLFRTLPIIGAIPVLLRVFYIIVGLSAIWVGIMAYMRFVASPTAQYMSRPTTTTRPTPTP